MITLTGASKWYGQVIGINDITCEIGPGITALLGMNGAGKSTLMKLVTGQLRPTTGDVKVLGMDPFANPEVYKEVGYCPEIDRFYERRTGRQFVNFLARISGMSAADAKRRTEEVLEIVGMSDRASKPIASYSKGMRQRIKLAQAMLLDPKIILLDEPLNGLDPVGRRELIDLLAWLAGQGRTVLVSSHILYEVEQMTRSLLLLHRGRLLATGDLKVIRSLIDKYPHKVRIETDDAKRLAGIITEFPNIVSLRFGIDGVLDLEVREPDIFYRNLNKAILDKNLPVNGFQSPDNNLEAVFSYLVER
ncbi:MAG: ABC transporter ATP-binding protein [Armatimonadetes bacterium]|nr:ABC transporter ATP-binding protein [Armatimonadota bacterium]